MVLLVLGLSTSALASPGNGYHAPATGGDPLFANQITITITKNFALADGTQQNIVTVKILNALGVPLDNVDVTFIINGGGVNQVIQTNASGIAVLYLTSTTVGPANVDIVIGGVHYPQGGPVTVVTFTLTAGPPDLTNPLTQVIVDRTHQTADGVATDMMHAHVVDANGNPVAGVTVDFAIFGGAAGPTCILSGLTAVTDANGNAIITATDTKIGAAYVTGKIGGVNLNNSPGALYFDVGPPDLTNPQTRLIVDVGTTTADGVSADQVHAHIVDKTGNPVPGVIVNFTIPGGSASGTATTTVIGTGVTDINGDIVLTITDPVAGTVDIGADVGGTQINNSPATVNFVAGPPDLNNPFTILVVDIGSTTADGVSTDKVHAHVVDAKGNVVIGATVVFTVSGGTAGGTAVILGTGITDASGNAVLTITNLKAGTVDISATIGGTALNNSPRTVVFVAGAPDLTNPQTQLITDIGSTTADGVSADKVHAHVVDANGNPVAGTTVVFSVTGGSSGGTAVTTIVGTGVTDANGDVVLLITNLKTGDVLIGATIGGTPINNSPADVFFVAGVPDLSNPLTSLIVDVGSTTADGVSTDQVHAHVVDAAGNIVSGATVVFTVTGGTAGGTAVIVGTGITNASGDAILTITNLKAGTVNISATIGGTAINNSPAPVIFVAGMPDVTNPLTKLVVDVTGAPANGTATNQVHAHIADANGNAVKNATVVFQIASGTGTFVGSTTVTTDANGDATITLTSTVAGSVDITATVNGIAIINNSPATVIFADIPDPNNPLTNLSVMSDNALADGQATNSVRAHIVDQNGNVLAGQHVVFTIASGDGTIITIQPVITDANGDAFIDITSLKPGYTTVTAKVEGMPIIFGSPAKVRFVAINIYVPHVFTPNGDGTNDVLKPILVGIAEFHYFSVYNRWGNLIFTTQDANNGWDGRFKGVAQPVETYLWIAEGITTEGKKIVQKGMVSLVR